MKTLQCGEILTNTNIFCILVLHKLLILVFYFLGLILIIFTVYFNAEFSPCLIHVDALYPFLLNKM